MYLGLAEVPPLGGRLLPGVRWCHLRRNPLDSVLKEKVDPVLNLHLVALLAPLAPLARALRSYSPQKLWPDLQAGLTVAVVEVPQAMAYALIAGVDPQYGLYTSIIQNFIGAMLSSGEHLTTGPTMTQALLINSALARFAGLTGAEYVLMASSLALIKSLIQLSFFAARLGDMVRFVSRSVFVGLAAGSGVLIMVGQLPSFLGFSLRGEGPPRFPGVPGLIDQMLPHFDQTHWQSVAIGCGALLIVVVMSRIHRLLPGPLVAVVAAAAVVAGFGLTGRELPLVNSFTPALPEFTVPWVGWEKAQYLVTGALALAMLGTIESVSIVKTLAVREGGRIIPNQEFLAQGVGNLVSSFFQCFPGSGSFTRSALHLHAGARSRLSVVFNALFVAAIFFALGGYAGYIPLTALAAVLFVIGYHLIDLRYMLRVARVSRSDLAVCIMTMLATMLVPLQYAIFVGVFLNISLHLRQASRLQMAEMVSSPTGPFMERPLSDRTGQQQVIFLQVEGQLFFALADEMELRLAALLKGNARVVIFRLKRTHSIDVTVLGVLEDFVKRMQSVGRHVVLCGLRPELMQKLRAYGLVETLGRENVFPTGGGAFDSAKKALLRARHLVGSSIDTRPIDTVIGPAVKEPRDYEI